MTRRPPIGPAAGTVPTATARVGHGRRARKRAVPRVVPLALVAAVLVGLSGGVWQAIGRDGVAQVSVQVPPAVGAAPVASPAESQTPSATPAATPTPTPSATPTPDPSPSVPAVAGLEPADLAAGLLSADVPDRGTGKLSTVPGAQEAPGPGRVRTFRVQVEGGIGIDGPAFAAFVFDILNDERGWGAKGAVSFERTDGPSDFRVVLASPRTSADMCRPLQTFGTLSCRNGDSTIITHFRWVNAIEEYADDRTGYRQYVINHEVGHFLGNGHVLCPGKGAQAPVMMQQTKGLKGCATNPWPYP